MVKKMVVTNLRMEENDYLQAKAMAAERNMSLNEYFNYLSRVSPGQTVFGVGKKTTAKKKIGVYEAFLKLAKSKHVGEGMGASEEDEIIYGV